METVNATHTDHPLHNRTSVAGDRHSPAQLDIQTPVSPADRFHPAPGVDGDLRAVRHVGITSFIRTGLTMNLPFFGKKETGPKRYSGLSKKSFVPKRQPKQEQSVSTQRGSLFPQFLVPRKLFHSIRLYLALIKSDIKRVLKVDRESQMKRQLHEDFMEEHFGKDWRHLK